MIKKKEKEKTETIKMSVPLLFSGFTSDNESLNESFRGNRLYLMEDIFRHLNPENKDTTFQDLGINKKNIDAITYILEWTIANLYKSVKRQIEMAQHYHKELEKAKERKEKQCIQYQYKIFFSLLGSILFKSAATGRGTFHRVEAADLFLRLINNIELIEIVLKDIEDFGLDVDVVQLMKRFPIETTKECMNHIQIFA